MDLRDKIKGWLNRPIAYVSGEINRLAPRERRLLLVLGGAVVGFAILVVGYLFVGSLRDIAQTNEDAREALATIDKHKDEYLDAKSRMMAQEVRIGAGAPQLAADLEAAARDVGIQIPETNPRAPVPAGKSHVEHGVEVTLRQVDLESLTKFLSKLETARRLIVVSQMNIRRRFSEGDKLDVKLTATAYERVKEDRTKKRPAPAGKTKI